MILYRLNLEMKIILIYFFRVVKEYHISSHRRLCLVLTQFHKIDHTHASHLLVTEACEFFAPYVGVTLHNMSVKNFFIFRRSSVPITMMIIDGTSIFYQSNMVKNWQYFTEKNSFKIMGGVLQA